MSSKIRVGVLTVSDTCALNPAADKSGPTIRNILAGDRFDTTFNAIVKDDVEDIQVIIKEWTSSEQVDLILTTGGTGFGVRDKTPEAVSALLERHASGIVHLLLSSSLKHTPLAALSRPVAGTIQSTLVVTLPGSVKAVKENLEALLSGGLLEHANDLIRGGTGKKVHDTLQVGAHNQSHNHGVPQHNHHHHHHHDHAAPIPRTLLSHDPSGAVSARHRSSPYSLITYEEALQRIKDNLTRLAAIEMPVGSDLKGHILAEDVHAPSDVPSTYTTSVDGYALHSTDAPGTYTVLTSQTHNIGATIPSGHIYRINTGGPLPAGADTVIMVEDTKLISTYGSDEEEKEVETLVQIPPGENVRNPGSDVKKGDLVLQAGERLTSVGGEIGTLAFVGRKHVQVYKRPIVAILSTGDEIIDIKDSQTTRPDKWGGIWDTNRPSLEAALQGMGYEVLDLGIVQDTVEQHVSALTRGLSGADIIITTGGTSMGPTDLLKPVIERNFSGTVHFGRVTIKPGKPTTFATIPFGGRDVPVFALPGNPASALVTFHVFVVPALRQLGGWPEMSYHLPKVQAQIESPMDLDSRTHFHRVIIKVSNRGLIATSTGGQRSSRVASLSGANGLVVLPQRQPDGPKTVDAGATVEVIVIGELQMA